MTAPDSGNFASEASIRLLERLAYQVTATLRSRDAAAVQKLHADVRRLARSLALFEDGFGPKHVRKIRRSLKKLSNSARAVHTCDAALQILARRRAETAGRLKTRLLQRRKESAATLTAILRQWNTRSKSSKWREMLGPR